ncbi:MAG: heat-inducible transcription repressor HrcA [Actinobacteria bacterium]|nr:heat-inducible transcription repressor HrcA [Actinomycetota bacterium]
MTDRSAHVTDDRLDERKESVLRAVVEEYVTTAEPVGSTTVTRRRRLGVSSATVRNDMAVLEREGYLAQPHTSAGRIPTDRGYRYFVDHLARVESLGPPHANTVSQFFATAQAAVEETLHETSQLLARITEHAALVVGPGAASTTVVTIQLVVLHPDAVLAVAVLSNGAVEKTLLQLDDGGADDAVRVAQGVVATAAIGKPLAAIEEPVPTGDRAADDLAARALGALRDRGAGAGNEPVYVGGTSNIAAEASDFSAIEAVSRLLGLLEQQFLVVSLAHSLIDSGVTVRIGAENREVALRECSIILAPVTVGEGVAGTVGVLGPTRMDYTRAMAAVTTVSESLARHLTG